MIRQTPVETWTFIRHGPVNKFLHGSRSWDAPLDVDQVQQYSFTLDEKIQVWCAAHFPSIIETSPYQQCRDTAFYLAERIALLFGVMVPIQINTLLGRRRNDQLEPLGTMSRIYYSTAISEALDPADQMPLALCPSIVETTEQFEGRCCAFLIKEATRLVHSVHFEPPSPLSKNGIDDIAAADGKVGGATTASVSSAPHIWMITHASVMREILHTLGKQSPTRQLLPRVKFDHGVVTTGKTTKHLVFVQPYIRSWAGIHVSR